MIEQCLNQVEDFYDCIRNGIISVCMVKKYSKVPVKDYKQIIDPDEIDDLIGSDNELGISLLGNEMDGQKRLVCIDVDGDKSDYTDDTTIQFSKDWFYQIIISKLDALDINHLDVRSTSGGYHIYVYCLEHCSPHKSTTNLQYPTSLEAAITGNEGVGMFLSSQVHQDMLETFLNKKTPQGGIEVWSKGRMIMAPGSQVKYEGDSKPKQSKVISTKTRKFTDISVIEEDLNKIIRDAFLDAGFTESETYQKTVFNKNAGMSDELDDRSIAFIGNLILKYYPLISGQKHECTLALGGFLAGRKISPESILKIGDYVLENKEVGLFRDDQAFINTLLHDSISDDQDKLTTGLNTLENILEPYCPRGLIAKQLYLMTNPRSHTFWPNGCSTTRYEEVVLDFMRNTTSTSWIFRSLKNGEYHKQTEYSYYLNNCIHAINFVNDLSAHKSTTEYSDTPVRIYYKVQNHTDVYNYMFNNLDDLFNNYRKLMGIGDTTKVKKIIQQLFNEFYISGLIGSEDFSTIPGIFLSADKQRLVRILPENGVLTEKPPEPIDKDKLANALELLARINRVFPWEDNKFGFIMKYSLTLPYANVLKTHYDKDHKFLILYGVSGTLKSTATEIMFHINLNSAFQSDCLSAASAGDSEFRLGYDLNASSYPIFYDEAEVFFTTDKLRNILKNAFSDRLLRDPGKSGKHYYANRIAVFTMNRLPPKIEESALARRIATIELSPLELVKPDEILQRLSFLNEGGILNSRLQELDVIGDAVLSILNSHIDWFNNTIPALQGLIIDELEKISGIDLNFMRVDTSLYDNNESEENNILSRIVTLLREPYLRHCNKYLQNSDPVAVIKQMLVSVPEYSFIHLTAREGILIDSTFKDLFNNKYGKDYDNITLKSCYEYLADLDLDLGPMKYGPSRVKGRKKAITGIRMSLDDFCKIILNTEELQQR